MPVVLAASVENAGVLLSLFIILAFAKIMAEIFERLRQPAVVGEILAGVIIGPSLLGWVESSAIKQMSKSNEVFCLVQSPNFSLPFRRASLAETR